MRRARRAPAAADRPRRAARHRPGVRRAGRRDAARHRRRCRPQVARHTRVRKTEARAGRGDRRGGDPGVRGLARRARGAADARPRCARAPTRSSPQVLAENAGRWESLTERDRERVEALARAVVKRLLHEPTLRVKGSTPSTATRGCSCCASSSGSRKRRRRGARASAAAGPPAARRDLAAARHARQRAGAGPGPRVAAPLPAASEIVADHHGRRRRPRARRQVALGGRAGGGAAGGRDRPRRALGQGRAGRARRRAPRSSAAPRAAPTPLDVLVGEHCATGARVGTSALRRRAQLLARAAGPRGPRAARERRHAAGEAHGRRGRRARARRRRARPARPPPRGGRALIDGVFVPAPGQGMIAVQARAGRWCRPLAGACPDEGRLEAEREVVRALGATCHTPVGILWIARTIRGFAGLPDGSDPRRRGPLHRGEASRPRRLPATPPPAPPTSCDAEPRPRVTDVFLVAPARATRADDVRRGRADRVRRRDPLRPPDPTGGPREGARSARRSSTSARGRKSAVAAGRHDRLLIQYGRARGP